MKISYTFSGRFQQALTTERTSRSIDPSPRANKGMLYCSFNLSQLSSGPWNHSPPVVQSLSAYGHFGGWYNRFHSTSSQRKQHMPIYQGSAPDIWSHLWGDGFMSPGGERNRAMLFGDRDIKGKRLLDIGCGGGGPGLKLVEERGVELVGIDAEPLMVEGARRRAKERGLEGRAEFHLVDPGPFGFADSSFGHHHEQRRCAHVHRRQALHDQGVLSGA